MNLKLFSVKLEPEVNRKYPDLLLVPRDFNNSYHSVMIEFKYLKVGENDKLEEMKMQAKEQIKEYSEFEDIKNISNLHKYTIVAVNDKLYIDEV